MFYLKTLPSPYGHLVVSMCDSDVVQDIDKLIAILEQMEQQQSLQREVACINDHVVLSHLGKKHDSVKNCMIKFRELPKKDGKEMEMPFHQ